MKFKVLSSACFLFVFTLQAQFSDPQLLFDQLNLSHLAGVDLLDTSGLPVGVFSLVLVRADKVIARARLVLVD